MAVFKIRCLALVMLVVGILVTFGDHGVVVYSDAQSCDGDIRGLVEQCSRYVMKLIPRPPPSVACCEIVKKVDADCVCSHVTKEVEALISMDKAVFVAAYCGRPLPSGTKCGSN
ncbi:Bifunctional inhibitor/plant lipid transfer protein/seed storage helical domain [Macleaya cordata]|uniref:Bifunctional inhibitor/plant lipid transfer protein/seed storage helical domain n=1 Tax=Macleaya cordata TaxID=56857 RepID=A0A200Q6I1_MACCD|nr:Bifunctional inhibitor/plant lipid transfer protein/seed storage helical domain [Macleaya cordata]